MDDTVDLQSVDDNPWAQLPAPNGVPRLNISAPASFDQRFGQVPATFDERFQGTPDVPGVPAVGSRVMSPTVGPSQWDRITLQPVEGNPYTDPMSGATPEQLKTGGNIALAAGQGVVNQLAAPGRVAQGQQPTTPGMWSDTDEAIAQANAGGQYNWAPSMALTMMGATAPEAAEENALNSGIRGYHATTSDFEKFANRPAKESYMLDRSIGTHFAADPKVSDSFIVNTVNDKVTGPKPGGRMIAADLPDESGFLTVDQPEFDYIKKDPEKYADVPIQHRVATDQFQIEKMIAKSAYQQDPEMLGRYLNQARHVPADEAQAYAAKLVNGGEADWGEGAHDLDRVISNFGGKPYNDADRERMLDLARTAWQKQGYRGLKYINTSPMETANATNPTAYVVFDPKDIKSAISGVTLGSGNRAAAPLALADLWHGVSNVKLPKPISEMSPQISGAAVQPSKIITPSDLQGGSIIPIRGDRSATGGQLTGFNGYNFDQPVDLQGGHGYMGVNAPRGAVWAGEKAPISALDKRAAVAAEKGPVYGSFTAMGPQAVDFSHHVSDVIAQAIPQAKITPANVKLFDQMMVKGNSSIPGIPDWPGIQSPNLQQYLRDAPGYTRYALAKQMDKGMWQKAGFPNMGEVRHAVTDPRLLNEPTGASGLSIARLNPGGARPASMHGTYPESLPGNEAYSFGVSVPKEDIYPDVVEALHQFNVENAARGKKPTRIDDMLTNTPRGVLGYQPTHQRWVDRLSAAIERRKSEGY